MLGSVPLPLTLILDAGVSFDVILPLSEGELRCAGELVGLEVGKGSAIMRLRFRSLAADDASRFARRLLASWSRAIFSSAIRAGIAPGRTRHRE